MIVLPLVQLYPILAVYRNADLTSPKLPWFNLVSKEIWPKNDLKMKSCKFFLPEWISDLQAGGSSL